MRKWLAAVLCPEMARDAQAYRRLWHGLDEARWWLFNDEPTCSALAQFLIERDAWFWSRGEVRRDMDFCPPKWVVGIDSFREWVRTKPFRKPAASPQPAPGAANEGADKEALAKDLMRVEYEESEWPLVLFRGRLIHFDNVLKCAANALHPKERDHHG